MAIAMVTCLIPLCALAVLVHQGGASLPVELRRLPCAVLCGVVWVYLTQQRVYRALVRDSESTRTVVEPKQSTG